MGDCRDCKNFNDGNSISTLEGPAYMPPVRGKGKGYCSKYDAYVEPTYSFPCFKPRPPKIKICPVCSRDSKKPRVITDNTLTGGYRQVQCQLCGVRGPHGTTDDWAIKRWNEEMLRKEGDE
jgi:hypothetical protein